MQARNGEKDSSSKQLNLKAKIQITSSTAPKNPRLPDKEIPAENRFNPYLVPDNATRLTAPDAASFHTAKSIRGHTLPVSS